MAYVEVDDVLNRAIVKHFFPTRHPTRTKRSRTLLAMLDKLYPQQKLDIIRTFKHVPSPVAAHIMALNDIRNSFAHRFDLSRVPKSRRLYRGKYDVFTKQGLAQFQSDMWDIDQFFQPEITNLTLDLVKHQRERNRVYSAPRIAK